eukprot:Blabericola_migrator_1__12510@NODE_791_length_6494_cov_76_751361_g560_i0_p3_GENE_NODE_791_length_6494_cov_76_751361_g560_i0NODE_791_length_6494_cov_76_751361_g560_i0_p3_ORF_typecomplete_len299_score26_33_NODE_791_length_6494_cov_76_751361_g560_i042865182
MSNLFSSFFLIEVLPLLPVPERFKAAQVCSESRAAVLCDKYEKEAFIYFLNTSLLYEEPWSYHPFPSRQSVEDRENTYIRNTSEIVSRMNRLGEIKTWHCLATRAARLAPWTVQLEVTPAHAVRGVITPFKAIASDIAAWWTAQASSNDRGCAQWYYKILRYIKAQEASDLLSVKQFFHQLNLMEINYQILGVELYHQDNNWKSAVRRRQVMNLTESHIIPKMIAAGFRPRCLLDEKWLHEMKTLDSQLRNDALRVILSEGGKQGDFCRVLSVGGENMCILTFGSTETLPKPKRREWW